MISNGMIYEDQKGNEHICKPIGRTCWVQANGSNKEECLISAITKTKTGEQIDKSRVKIAKVEGKKLEIYILFTGQSYYFVRKISNNYYQVILDNNGGFSCENAKIFVKQEGEITVFCFRDKESSKRVTPFYYVKW